jgi:6-phosphogluconolactonase (cycloisomerase 2 family)
MLSLALALGVTACSNDYTVSYIYMATAKTLPHGLINAYQVDYQSGFLRPLDDSPIDAGGRDTVGLVIAPNNLFLYTVNNFDSDVVEYAIGTDGKLYPENTYNIAGSLPTAAAIDASGKFLYVTFTYQNNPNGTELYTPGNPGPGGISVFPINTDNTLGTPFTVNVGRNPVGIATSPVGNYVYVIEQDSAVTTNTTTGNTGTNNLLAFQENASTGALTPLPGVTIVAGNAPSIGYPSGTCALATATACPTTVGADPTAILEDPTGTHLYVTDGVDDQIASYSIAAGVPTLISSGGVRVVADTEGLPNGMTFDLSHQYLYVVNYNANTIDTFAVGSTGFTVSSGGQPARLASVQTGTGPTCLAVTGAPSDASATHGEYLYTSNALSNNITAEQVNQQTGVLDQIAGTPFGGSALPTCIATAPAFPTR